MSAHILKAPAGLGKTTQILTLLEKSPERRIEFYVPTLGLAKEINEKLTAKRISSRIILGRSQLNDTGQTMCEKPELAAEVAKLGFPVFPVICMGLMVPGELSSQKSCNHIANCKYLAQFTCDDRVLIYTHAYLPLPRNNKEKINPGLVIIDESFLSTCLETFTISRGYLTEKLKGSEVANSRRIVKCVLKALDAGVPVLQECRNAGIDAKKLKLARNEVSSSGASFNPYFSDAEFLKKLKNEGIQRTRIDILLDILAAELSTPRTEIHGITLDRNGKNIQLHFRKSITRFEKGNAEPTIILIDANADQDLLEPWFPGAKFTEIAANRNAHVTQCSSIRGSTSSFVPAKHTDANSKSWAERNVLGLNELLARCCRDTSQNWLVVGPQIITGNQNKGISPIVTKPANCEFAHFNGLRGVDAYKDFHGVIIIGRNQPPIAGLEQLARCLWHDSLESLIFASDWILEVRPYRVRDSRQPISVEVQVHPDPRIQRLHEQLREGESTQAIDRLRLIHAKTKKQVIVVSNVPLDLDVDALMDFDRLARQSRLERVMDLLGGILPLSADFLSSQFPAFWPSKEAAKKEAYRAVQRGQTFNNISIKSLSPLPYEYRVPGQSRPSRLFSVHPIAQTRAILAGRLRKPIVLRPIVDGIPGIETFGAYAHCPRLPLAATGSASAIPYQPTTPTATAGA
jgi:hypothetical protein